MLISAAIQSAKSQLNPLSAGKIMSQPPRLIGWLVALMAKISARRKSSLKLIPCWLTSALALERPATKQPAALASAGLEYPAAGGAALARWLKRGMAYLSLHLWRRKPGELWKPVCGYWLTLLSYENETVWYIKLRSKLSRHISEMKKEIESQYNVRKCAISEIYCQWPWEMTKWRRENGLGNVWLTWENYWPHSYEMRNLISKPVWHQWEIKLMAIINEGITKSLQCILSESSRS